MCVCIAEQTVILNNSRYEPLLTIISEMWKSITCTYVRTHIRTCTFILASLPGYSYCVIKDGGGGGGGGGGGAWE